MIPITQKISLKNSSTNYLVGSHLPPLGLNDEPEPVAGDGADAEGGHEDWKVLTRFHELADELGVAPERPVALQGVPQSQR